MIPKLTPKLIVHSTQQRQSGAALITGLIFLVVLTMIGVTAARMSTLEERMSGNMRDRSIAMHAAEMALRDAERDIRSELAPGVTTNPRRSPVISGITGFSETCNLDNTNDTHDDGLCDRRGNLPTYSITTISFPAFTVGAVNFLARDLNMIAAPSVAYGRFTGATNLVGLSALPRYLIEGIRKNDGSSDIYFYRVTSRAQGVNPNTVVWLQAVYRP